MVSYAAAKGHHNFAAMVPQTAYGDVAEDAFTDAVTAAHGASRGCRAFRAQCRRGDGAGQRGGQERRRRGADRAGRRDPARHRAHPVAGRRWTRDKVKLLGTGLWDDASAVQANRRWRAAGSPRPSPMPMPISTTNTATPMAPRRRSWRSLAYDAVSLVALLSQGTPYHRFTTAALMDPNGFAGVNGIFRFNADGTSERGLAVLEVTAGRLSVSSAPRRRRFSRSPSA